MPIKRPQLVNKEIYHIVFRAIEGLKLFRDEKDYFRMIHDLFEFNDENPVSSYFRHDIASQLPRNVLGSWENRRKRKILGEILAFCLMPNHIHLLIRQLREGGISKFMRKIGAGYGGYYNQKYKRKGHLFDGRHRLIHIQAQEQLKTVFVYIHTNPVALVVSGWKDKGLKAEELNKAIKFLENYRWSSYLDYLGKKNFPSVTQREILLKVMSGSDECREFVKDWLQFKVELRSGMEKIAIE